MDDRARSMEVQRYSGYHGAVPFRGDLVKRVEQMGELRYSTPELRTRKNGSAART